jgi:hypothetical protein
MRSLRSRVAVALCAVSLVTAAPAASGQAEPASPEAVAAHRCSSGYTHAHLPWGQKCLRAGQFCKKDRNRVYHRYGYRCQRNGHLRRQ